MLIHLILTYKRFDRPLYGGFNYIQCFQCVALIDKDLLSIKIIRGGIRNGLQHDLCGNSRHPCYH